MDFEFHDDTSDSLVFYIQRTCTGCRIYFLFSLSPTAPPGCILISVVALLIAILLSFLINGIIYKPIGRLVLVVREHGTEHAQDRLLCRKDEIGFLFRSFREILAENGDLIKNDYEKKILLKNAEIRLLHSQINPHLLYNSLGSIIWMAKSEQYSAIQDLVGALIKFYRMSLNKENEIVSLREVKEQIECYLSIQKIRYSDRLRVEIDFEESILRYKMLKLLLQPVVENSIAYGIEKKVGDGVVKVTAKRADELLLISVEDNGVGVSAERLEEINAIIHSDEQPEDFSVLQNINRRIKLFYGDEFGISLSGRENKGMTVSISVPVLE